MPETLVSEKIREAIASLKIEEAPYELRVSTKIFKELYSKFGYEGDKLNINDHWNIRITSGKQLDDDEYIEYFQDHILMHTKNNITRMPNFLRTNKKELLEITSLK